MMSANGSVERVTQPSRRRGLIGALTLFALAACSPAPKAPTPAAPLTVFAAASLTDALGVIARNYERETGRPVRLSFGASGQVARQIDAGAPADVVILADEDWMDRLAASGRIQPSSRSDLLRNRLVVIAGAQEQVDGEPIAWLQRTRGRLVIGDPDSVPAGAYAKEWLEGRNLWTALQPLIVTAADVRAVRTFVVRGEAELGIVYRSDAIGVTEIKVVGEPEAQAQPDIVYPAALTTAAAPGATAFLRYLGSRQAAAVFCSHGFDPHG